jgi:hypothetical protein
MTAMSKSKLTNPLTSNLSKNSFLEQVGLADPETELSAIA